MFGAIWGSILFLFGFVIVGYTIYTMIMSTPKDEVGWVFSSFYIVGGFVIAWYGYRTLYPAQPILFGGRRR